MKAIHLIQNNPDLRPWPTEKGSQDFKSGYWDLTPAQAKSALGAHIYFHERKVAPSFFGGIITDYEIKPDDPWKGRIIFTLKQSRESKEVRTERQGWSMVMKIVN